MSKADWTKSDKLHAISNNIDFLMNLNFSIQVLPKPITKRKEKEHKKKKNKSAGQIAILTSTNSNHQNVWKSSEAKKTGELYLRNFFIFIFIF